MVVESSLASAELTSAQVDPLTHALDRAQGSSQQSISMSRKRSNSSQHGPSSEFPSSSMPAPSLDTWELGTGDPFSIYSMKTDRALKLQRTGSGSRPMMILYNNAKDFEPIQECAETSLSPVAPRTHRSRRSSHRLSSSPGQGTLINSSLSQSPATFTNSELTPTTTLSGGDMSRQSSHDGSSICGGLDMMKIRSQISEAVSPGLPTQVIGPSFSGSFSSACSRQSDLRVLDDGGPSVPGLHMTSSAITHPSDPVTSQCIAEDTTMKRSDSTETNASNHSRASRRSLQDVNQNARPIAPKPYGGISMSREPSSSGHQLVRIRSADGSSKVSIPKVHYSRPSNDKAKCAMCNEKPEGFRGEHELRRHVESKHSVVKKIWTCVDISPDRTFLAGCKPCSRNKTYNAYYNAGAHLRRSHFNKKPKGQKGKVEAEDKPHGKDNKCGSVWPPMDMLKEWMLESEIVVRENEAHLTEDAAADEDDDEDDETDDTPGEAIRQENLPPLLSNPETRPNLVGSPASTPDHDDPHSACFLSATSPFTLATLSQSEHYDDAALQLSLSNVNASELFDLSQDTSIHHSSTIAPLDSMFPMDMSPLESQPFYDGLNDSFFS